MTRRSWLQAFEDRSLATPTQARVIPVAVSLFLAACFVLAAAVEGWR